MPSPKVSSAQLNLIHDALKSSSPINHRREWNDSYLSLVRGRFPFGWDQFESRLMVPGVVTPKRHFTHPRWDGQAFPGRTLLLHYEQGLGDTLMFIRYAPLVKALGGTVVFASQAQLSDLVATVEGIDQVVPKGTPPPPFDFHFPLLSLPWLFRTTLNTIPGPVPYLQLPSTVPNRASLAELLRPKEGQLKVGLAWKGSSDHPRDKERSVAPGVLSPLQDLPHIAWYGFQREEGIAQPFSSVCNLGPKLSNFSDSAFALQHMDLLITVDTAIAHLAGALGVPALVLLTHKPDWRWMLERSDTPWYPTLRLYRQPQPGDWKSVIQKIQLDLTQNC